MTLAEYKDKKLSDPETKEAYDALQAEYALAQEIISARIESNLTQAQLAKMLNTKQSCIARLESGNSNPTLGFLQKVALAMGKRLTFSLQ